MIFVNRAANGLNLWPNITVWGSFLQMLKRGRIRKPENGEMGILLLSFIARGVLCRESCPVIVTPRRKAKLKIETRQLQVSHHWGVPWQKNKKKKARPGPPSFSSKLWKVEISTVKPTTMQEIAEQRKTMFQSSDRTLLGLRYELDGQVQTWSTDEFLKSEAYLGLSSANKTLENIRNNGSSGSQIRFYEKMERLCKIPLATMLNVNLEQIDEVLSSVERELENFA